jgi:hypothetical protein
MFTEFTKSSAVWKQKEESRIMMHPLLTLSRANVGADEFARFNFGDSTAFDAGIKVPRQIRRINWTSFDLFFEKALALLSALYLLGAIGFSAVLVFNAFAN